MKLRWYQDQAVKAVWDYLRNKDGAPCVVLPTGSGKTYVIAELCRQVVEWGGRAIVLAHVRELLEQSADKLVKCVDPDLVGIYSAGLNERTTNTPIVVAGIQSVYFRADELGAFQLIIVDEAHLIPPNGSGMYRQFLESARELSPQARLVGLTATPYRMGCGWITKDRANEREDILQDPYDRLLDDIVYEVGVDRLIADGTLSRVVSVSASKRPSFAGVKTTRGDFDEEEVEKILTRTGVIESACLEIIEKTKDRKKVVVFCNRRESAWRCAAFLEKHAPEYEAAVVDGDTTSGERAELVRRFKKESGDATLIGETKPLKYVCNVGVLTTGFDASLVDCVVLLRPTQSLALYQQMVGRGLRTAPGKADCLVLDYGGNVDRHGPIDLARPTANLSDAKKVWKECRNCGAIVASFFNVCPICQAPFAVAGRNWDVDPNKKLVGRASSAALLSSDEDEPSFEINEYDVRNVKYNVHYKRNAPPDKPPTVQVSYSVDGPYFPVREWLCPEHDGWARKKFEGWWTARSKTPPPHSAETCARYANAGALAYPKRIRTTVKNGEKFPKIEWIDATEPQDFNPRAVAYNEAYEENFQDAFLSEFAAFAPRDEQTTLSFSSAKRTHHCRDCRNWSHDDLDSFGGYCTKFGTSEPPEGTNGSCFEEPWDDEELPF